MEGNLLIHVDPSKEIRTFTIKNGDKDSFPLFNIGRESYINSFTVDFTLGTEIINIQIGSFCSIANNVLFIVNRNHDYKSVSTSTTPILSAKRKLRQKGQIIIGNDVWIGNNVTILSGVVIGNGAVIGAGTVISKDVPSYSIVVGNPQKIVKYRFSEDQIKKLEVIKWWNWDYNKIEENKQWFMEDIDIFINKSYPQIIYNDIEKLNIDKRNNSLLFIPDFYEPYPIWEKVLREYSNKFSFKDETTLILRIMKDENSDKHIKTIQQIIFQKSDYPDVIIIKDKVKDERCLFKEINCFISTRCKDTLKYMEFCKDFNVEIKSGVDIPIF